MHFRKLQLKKYEEEVRRQSAINSNEPKSPNRVEHSEAPRTLETGTRTVKSLKWLAMNRIIDPGLKHKTAYFKDLREKELAKKAKMAELRGAPQSIEPVAQKSENDPTPTVDSKSQNDATTPTPAEDLKISRTTTPAEDFESVASTSKISVLRYAPQSIESVAQKSENDPTPTVDSQSENDATTPTPAEDLKISRISTPAEDLESVASTSKISVLRYAPQSIESVAQKSENDPTPTVDSKSQNDATTSIPAEDLKTSRISTTAEDLKSVASTSKISVLRYAPPSIESVAQKSENDPTPTVDSKLQNGATTSIPAEDLKTSRTTTPAEDLESVASTSQYTDTTTTSEEPQSEVDMEEIFQTHAKLMDLLQQLKTTAKDHSEVDDGDYPYFSPLNPNEAIIGPKYTTVNAKKLMNINWSVADSLIIRKLLMMIFDRATLATHTLSGKPSPAFGEFDMPEKQRLDPDAVSDLIFFMNKQCGTTPKEVRLTITTKCADEAKMMRTRKRKLGQPNKSRRAKPY